jgi:hypothetical protein
MNLLIYVGRVDWCFRRLSNYADGMLWDDDENTHHWSARENPTGFTMVYHQIYHQIDVFLVFVMDMKYH